MRNRAARKVLRDIPWLTIGSPMCTIHSTMNQINHARMPPEVVKASFEYARMHLKFATPLYKIQVQGGRYVLHEHPASASSWDETCIQEILGMKGVNTVIGDQCCYGLRSRGEEGIGPARKSTGFMTKSAFIAKALNRKSDPPARTLARGQGQEGCDLPEVSL